MKLYIDPGTGSMLFTILIGILGAARYLFKSWFVKLRFSLTGGREKTNVDEKIPLVIFTDDKRYWSVFEPVCRELAFRHFPVRYLTASPDDSGLQCQYEGFSAAVLPKGNKAFAKLNFLKAAIVLSTTPGLDVYQWKRSPGVDCYIHIPHAATDLTLYHMFGIDYYDVIMVSGEYQEKQVRHLEELRHLPAKEMVEIGIPYMDEMLKRLGNCPRAEKNTGTTVLLAPTWGPSGILSVYGGEIIRLLLGTGYHLIIRPHPQSFTSEKDMIRKLMQEFPESEQLEWNRDADNFDVLNRSDIMISDFSGVMIDYALVYDKPVIYTDTKFDNGLYDAWWLEESTWVFSVLPKIGVMLNSENQGKIKELIDGCLRDEQFAQGRREAVSECWMHRGEGARRAADYLAKKYEELSAVKKKEE